MAWCMAQHQAEEKESSSVYVHVLYSVQVSISEAISRVHVQAKGESCRFSKCTCLLLRAIVKDIQLVYNALILCTLYITTAEMCITMNEEMNNIIHTCRTTHELVNAPMYVLRLYLLSLSLSQLALCRCLSQEGS